MTMKQKANIMFLLIAENSVRVLDTVKHLYLAAANFGIFFDWTFWQIFILADLWFLK